MHKTRTQQASGWKQWTPDEAREALRRWAASGKPLATYAREVGVSVSRLSWWKKRLGEWLGEPEESMRLVPVVARVEPSRSPTRVTVHLPGEAWVELDASAQSAAWVAAVALHLVRAR